MNYRDLCRLFDDLIAEGIIHYSPPRIEKWEEDGFAIEFLLALGTVQKPQSGAKLTKPPQKPQTECFGPGSDLANDHPRMLIETIDTHLLIFNKFCVLRPQLLLLTKDSYRRQTEPLDLEDFKAGCRVLGEIEEPHLLFFNCGPIAGASREHKHLQIIPRPRHIFPDDRNGRPNVPFKYFLKYIDEEKRLDAAALHRAYEELLLSTKEALQPFISSGIPHNVIIDRHWLLVVPRRSRAYRDATTNAAGMIGSIWLSNEDQLAQWKEVGVRNALGNLGLPA